MLIDHIGFVFWHLWAVPLLIDAFGVQNRVATPKRRITKSPGSVPALELCLGIVWKLNCFWPEPSRGCASPFNTAVIEFCFQGLVPDTAQLICVVIPRSSVPSS